MGIFSNCFEKKWFAVFMFLYFFIMIPFPFFYSRVYIPGPWGIPLFIVGWLVYGLIVIGTICVFASQALKRPEYHQFDEIGDSND